MRWSPPASKVPGGERRRPVDHEVVALRLGVGPEGAHQGHHAGQAVGLLHPQLRHPPEHRGPLGARRGHGQHRHLVEAGDLGGVDRRWRRSGAGADHDVRRGGQVARPVAATSSMAAPMRPSTSRKPAPARPDVDALHGDLAAGDHAGGHDPEGGLRRVARGRRSRRARPRPRRTRTTCPPSVSTRDVGAAAGPAAPRCAPGWAPARARPSPPRRAARRAGRTTSPGRSPSAGCSRCRAAPAPHEQGRAGDARPALDRRPHAAAGARPPGPWAGSTARRRR